MRATLPIALMATLWWSSSRELTATAPNVLRSLLHNAMHVVAYCALGASLLLWLGRVVDGVSSRRAATASVALSIAYGVVDEIHQSFVRGRTCSVVDVVSDALGAVLGVTVVGSLLAPDRKPGSLVPLLVAASVASVALATFGPW